MKVLVCHRCGKTFKVKDSRSNAKFCSRECYLLDKRDSGVISIKCLECGKEFTSKKSNHRKFCSKECYLLYYKKEGYYWNKKDRVKVICQQCGKEEYVIRSRSKRYKYCSKLCESKARTKSLEERNLTMIECPICKREFLVKTSSKNRRKCCSKKCTYEYKKIESMGDKNPNYRGYIIEDGVKRKSYERYKDAHQRIVFDYFGCRIPKSYHIHHKDCNPMNNSLSNLVVLPCGVHMSIHRWFGNILLNAITTNLIDRDTFYSLLNEEQKLLYENIIDLNITNQVVIKQGELLGSPEVDNQQTSIYKYIYVGSSGR